MAKENMANVLAIKLVALRKAKGLTQKQVAMLAGIPLPILRMMEHGQIIPCPEMDGLADLCLLFGVTADDLFGVDLQQ